MTAARWVATTALLLSATAACGAPGDEASDRVTVFAAASLTEVFTGLGEQFRQAHPGTEVVFTFAGSADLVAQVQQGAGADVIATADETTMATLTEGEMIVAPATVFATNRMAIAVPPDNPARIQDLTDLQRPGVSVVVCAPQVPCGSATAAIERASRVSLSPVSEETSVSGVVGKVASAEADAGIVYVTDVAAAGRQLAGVDIPGAVNVVNRYPIALTASTGPAIGEGPAAAREFVDFVTGPEGRAALRRAGFGAP